MTREEAIQAIGNLVDMNIRYKCDTLWVEALRMAIEALSAEHEDYEHATLVDIKEPLKVLVVRCKDCKHYIVEGITTQYGWCHEYKHYVNEDDFCSYGERGITMTREEAAAILEDEAEYLYSQDEPYNREAFNMAIEALKADVARWSSWNKTFEQSGIADLISRADAIEAVASVDKTNGTVKVFSGLEIIDILKALPSADRPHEDISEDGTLKVNVTDGAKVKRVLVWGDNNFGGLYYPDDRPTGEWIVVAYQKDGEEYIRSCTCSECGSKSVLRTNFCPNCGARMRGAE